MASSPVVLHLFSLLEPGGAELRTLEVMESLKGRPVQFVVAATTAPGGSLTSRFVAAGAVIEFAKLGWRFPADLRRIVQRHDVTAIHTHAATASGAFMFLAWLLRVPVRIAHFRSDGDGADDGVRRRIQRAVMRSMIRVFATDVLAVSPVALEFAGAWTNRSDRARALPSGLVVPPVPDQADTADLRTSLMPDQAATLIVHVGRDHPVKNRGRAVRILQACSQAGMNAYLVLVGRAPDEERAQLLDEAGRMGVADRVVFTGQVSNPCDYLSAADLTLVTSLREGLPGVVLESVAVGTPVLSSNLPGSQWIAEEFASVTCLDLAQADSEWSDRVMALAGAPTNAQRVAARERFLASKFSMEMASQQFADVWGVTQ